MFHDFSLELFLVRVLLEVQLPEFSPLDVARRTLIPEAKVLKLPLHFFAKLGNFFFKFRRPIFVLQLLSWDNFTRSRSIFYGFVFRVDNRLVNLTLLWCTLKLPELRLSNFVVFRTLFSLTFRKWLFIRVTVSIL